LARYREDRAFRPTSGDTGATHVYGKLAESFGRFADAEMERYKQARIVDAQEDAAQSDPRDTELRNKKTVYGQEFNKHLIASHQAALKSDYSLKLERFAIEHPDNPTAFKDKADKVREDSLSGALPEVRQALELDYDNLAGSYLNRIHGNNKKIETDRMAAQDAASIDRAKEDILRLFRNNQDQAGAEALAAFTVQLPMMGKTELEQREILGEVQRGVIDQTLYDDIEDLTPEQAFKSLEESAKKVPSSHSPAEWDLTIGKARSLVTRNKTIRNVSDGANYRGMANTVNDTAKAIALAYPVDAQEMAAAYRAAGAIDAKNKDGRATKALNDAEQVAAFSILSISEQNEIINSTSGVENVDLYANLTKTRATINKAANKDLIGTATSQGLYQGALEFTPEGLAARSAASSELAKHYGVNRQMFSEAESAQLTADLEVMTPADKVARAAIIGTLPNNTALNTWGEIAEKNSPVFAMAGATGDQNVMLTIFNGQARVEAGLVKKPSQQDYLTTYTELVEDIYPVKDSEAMLQASLNHYMATSTENFDPEMFENSIHAVSGGIAEINGYKLELPRGVPHSQFDRFIDNFPAELIRANGGIKGLDDEAAANVVSRSRILSSPEGYKVTNGSFIQMNKAGGEFIFQYDGSINAPGISVDAAFEYGL